MLFVAALICLIASQRCVAQTSRVEDVLTEQPEGVSVLFSGQFFENFERPLPAVVETSIFDEFEGFYNHTQEFHATGGNAYVADGRQVRRKHILRWQPLTLLRTQFVVSIAGGRVSGVMGSVYDARGRVYAEFSPSPKVPAAEVMQGECKHFKRLATSVQKYGHMYYHFMQEVMPRIILLRPFLDADTKLLIFGAIYEYKWLAALGISSEQVEVYNPEQLYCADELIVPTMSPVITPPKENYELLRSTFGIEQSLPDSERDLVVYCSRRGADDREVAHEEVLLAAMAAKYPAYKLYIFTGKESTAETIQLFRKARVVAGIHGAGLSHLVFSAPGTAVIEFLFMYDPPMMFWHASAAMGMRYIMVPLPQSWWLDQLVNVQTQDVLDALALAFGSDSGPCNPGFALSALTGKCEGCLAGSYRAAGASACFTCAPGRHSSASGSGFCSICPTGTYSDDARVMCQACPAGTTTMFPGSADSDACILVEEVDARLDHMFTTDVLTKKLVALPSLDASHPKTAMQWISLGLSSPRRLLHAFHQRTLQRSYLKQLFDTDSESSIEELDSLVDMDADLDVQEGSRSLLYSGRRLSYSGRRLSYSGRRHLSYSGRRQLLYSGKRLLYSGRRLLYSGRRLLYSGRRILYSGRRLFYSGRRMLYSGRKLLYNGRRQLSNAVELDSSRQQHRRELTYTGRLLQYSGRRLTSYGRRLVSCTRSLHQKAQSGLSVLGSLVSSMRMLLGF